MELRIYLRMLQKGWWIIFIATIVAINASLLSSYLATPLYRTTASFIIGPNQQLFSNERDLVNSIESLDKRSIILTYAEALKSERVLNDALDILQLSPQDIEKYQVSAVVLPDASIIELSVEGPDPELATLLANTVGLQSISYLSDFYEVYQIQFLDLAKQPSEPFSPRTVRDVSTAIPLGFIVGALLAILSEQLQTSLESLLARSKYDNESSAFTRQYFSRRVQDEMADNQFELHSLGIVQLTGLRETVDTLPSILAQRIVRELYKKLKNELRGSDFVGRWSQTDFAIFLPSTPQAAAERTFTRIQAALDEPMMLDGTNELVIDIDPYIGIASRIGSEIASELVSRAEKALENGIARREKVLMNKVSAFTTE